MSIASRVGNPVPEAIDVRGAGVVDFKTDRVWTTDRLITDRIAMERDRHNRGIGRLVDRIARRAFNRTVGTELYYVGGARWKKGQQGWRGPEGSPNGPKDSWHPLFLFGLLSEVRLDLPSIVETDEVAGVSTTRVELQLGPNQLSPGIWVEVSDGDDLAEPVRAIVWFDEMLRLRRLSFEAVRGKGTDDNLWLISELMGFGDPFDVPANLPKMPVAY